MDVVEAVEPVIKPVFQGKTVGIIFSQITQGSQNSPDNIKAHFEAIEKSGCDGILIIISDVLNEPMLPLDHTSKNPMSERRIRAFELGVNFLKNPQILRLILSLKLPFKILSAAQLVYEDIPGINFDTVFYKPSDDSEEAMEFAILQTTVGLGLWAQEIKSIFQDKRVAQQRNYMAAHVQIEVRATQIESYKSLVNRLVKDVRRRPHNAQIAEQDVRAFIDDEAAFSIALGDYNTAALATTEKKAFDILVYTGGKPNRPLEDIRKNVVPVLCRWEQYHLVNSTLVEVDSRYESPDLSQGSNNTQGLVVKPLKLSKPRSGSASAPATGRTDVEPPPDIARTKGRKALGGSISNASLMGVWWGSKGHHNLHALTTENQQASPRSVPTLLKVRASCSDPEIKASFPILAEDGDGEQGESVESLGDNKKFFDVKNMLNIDSKPKVVVFFLNPFLSHLPDFNKTIREYFGIFGQVGCVKIRIVLLDIFRVDLNSNSRLELNIDTCVKVLKDLIPDVRAFKFPYQIVLGSQLVFDMYKDVDINIRRLFKGSAEQIALNLDNWAMRLKQSIPADTKELVLNLGASELFSKVSQYFEDNLDGFKNAVNAWFAQEFDKPKLDKPKLRESYQTLALLLSTLYLMLKEMGASHTLCCHEPLPKFLKCLAKGPNLLNNSMPHFEQILGFIAEFTVVMPKPQLIGPWAAAGGSLYSKVVESQSDQNTEVAYVARQIMGLLTRLQEPESAQLVFQELISQWQNLLVTPISSSQSIDGGSSLSSCEL